jgi:hypothetical protein
MARQRIETLHPEVTSLVLHLRHRPPQTAGHNSYLTTRSYDEIAEALQQRGYARADGRPLSANTIGRILCRGMH